MNRVSGMLWILLVVFLAAGSVLPAKTWNVRSGMTRADIQQIVDRADDHDRIQFHRGEYDFSDAPFALPTEDTGAIIIRDKSLTLRGLPGAVIIGAPSEVGPDGYGSRGITAFFVNNPAGDKSVTFENLELRSFLVGIQTCHSNQEPANYIVYANLDNLTVSRCSFSDIHRTVISACMVQGSVFVNDNIIDALRLGIVVKNDSADFNPHDGVIQIKGNRIVHHRGGIYVLYHRSSYQPQNTLLEIDGNDIDGQNSFASGFGIYLACCRRALVRANTVRLTNTAIDLHGALAGTIVERNTLQNCYWGIHLYGFKGISGQFETSQVLVANNELTGMTEYGIVAGGEVCFDNRIMENRIVMASGNRYYAGGLVTEGHGNLFSANEVSGVAGHACIISTFDYHDYGGSLVSAYDETFLDNRVSGLAALQGHYLLVSGTHDNRVMGWCPEQATYIDYGVGNLLACLVPY